MRIVTNSLIHCLDSIILSELAQKHLKLSTPKFLVSLQAGPIGYSSPVTTALGFQIYTPVRAQHIWSLNLHAFLFTTVQLDILALPLHSVVPRSAPPLVISWRGLNEINGGQAYFPPYPSKIHFQLTLGH